MSSKFIKFINIFLKVKRGEKKEKQEKRVIQERGRERGKSREKRREREREREKFISFFSSPLPSNGPRLSYPHVIPKNHFRKTFFRYLYSLSDQSPLCSPFMGSVVEGIYFLKDSSVS